MHRLIDELEAVEDPRIGNAKKHKLGDTLFIAIAAGVADADTWNQIEDYAVEHEEFSGNIWNCPQAFHPSTPLKEILFSAFGAENETEESQ